MAMRYSHLAPSALKETARVIECALMQTQTDNIDNPVNENMISLELKAD